ncbi:serine hydrolase [Sphingoaurantiacus capsulatus]|uniref:Serine hydrolase n=1 Tax=Sphingoaurantiacus capsulatus TaxID=1771310 RepID=A0ABV7XEU3_9SPHN
MGAQLSRRHFIGAATSLAAASASGAFAAEADPKAALLKAEIERLAREEDFSGAVLFAKGNNVLLQGAWGLAERNFAVPNRADLRFNLASMGKMFTSLAVMRLAAAGKLDLDAPLIFAWPDYPNRVVAEAVTPAQLLSHMSGLGNYVEAFMAYAGPPLLTNDDYLRLFVNDPLPQPPGQRFVYSNSGYVLLGCLVEKLTGEPLFDHLRRTLWAPLGMTATGPARADQSEPGLAYGYSRALDRPGHWQSNLDPRAPVGSAAGGIYSTVADIDRFAAALAAGTLLPPALDRRWTTGAFPYRRGKYALGISETTINGHRIIGHTGGHPGIATELMVFTDPGYRLTILTNGEVDGYFALAAFAKKLLTGGSDDVTRNQDFARSLVKAFAEGGETAASALLAAKPAGVVPSYSLLEVLGQRSIHRGQTDLGLGVLRFGIRVSPDDPWARWSLAEALRLAGRRDAALAAYRDYLTKAPDDADAKRWIERLSR